jgi:hypothetical protein
MTISKYSVFEDCDQSSFPYAADKFNCNALHFLIAMLKDELRRTEAETAANEASKLR